MEGAFKMVKEYELKQVLKENIDIKKAVEEKFQNSSSITRDIT